jgi:hypothetical protein
MLADVGIGKSPRNKLRADFALLGEHTRSLALAESPGATRSTAKPTRKLPMKSFIAVVFALFLAATSARDTKADWDAGRDLKAVEVTNGPLELLNPNASVSEWSYGYRPTIEGAALTLFSDAAGQHTNSEVGYPGFDGWKRIDQNGPVLLVNAGSGPLTLDFGGGPLLPLPAGFIDMHPGVDNSVPVVRWTTPATATYQIRTQWIDLDSFGGDGASADIKINGVPVFHNELDNGGATSDSRSVTLTIGDTVDFVTGARSDYAYDTTAFNAVITPEPSSIILTALALLGLTFYRRKTSRLFSCRRIPLVIACAVVFYGGSCSASTQLISVDFGIDGSDVQSGVELQAATADPAFAAANIWNQLNFVYFGPDQDPSFSGLFDSEGNTTTAGLSITGTVAGYSFGDPAEPLRTDFMFFNSRALSSSIEWHITGLAPNSAYRLFAYGGNGDFLRDCEIAIDTNGNGSLADEVAKLIGSASTDSTQSKDAFFASILSDGNGTILGRTAGIGTPADEGDVTYEANWGGFQIAAVPEPTSIVLAAIGLFSVAFLRSKVVT